MLRPKTPRAATVGNLVIPPVQTNLSTSLECNADTFPITIHAVNVVNKINQYALPLEKIHLMRITKYNSLPFLTNICLLYTWFSFIMNTTVFSCIN